LWLLDSGGDQSRLNVVEVTSLNDNASGAEEGAKYMRIIDNSFV